MKLVVNIVRCCGHARCAALAPELFILDERGHLATPEIEVPQGLEALARKGARACPEACIKVVKEEQA